MNTAQRMEGPAGPGAAASPVTPILCLLLLLLLPAPAGFAAELRDDYQITKWETDDGLPENSSTAICQTADGYLWFGSFNGLVRFDGVTFTVFDPSNTPELPSSGIVNLHLHRSGRLWISTYRGLVTLKDGKWSRAGVDTSWSNRFARTFSENASGQMCATSFDGAICRIEGEKVVELPPPPDARHGFSGYMDPEGGIHAVSREFFGRWTGDRWVRSEAAEVVTNRFLACTTARDGGLWVLANTNLLRISAGRVIRSIPTQDTFHNIWGLFQDDDGTFWVPSYEWGLHRISPDGSTRLFNTSDGLSHNSLRCVFRDRERNLWVGTSGGGLMRLRPATFTRFGTEAGRANRAARLVKSVCEASPGVVLMGTYGEGVARLDPAAGLLVPWSTNLGTHYTQCVLVDRRGRSWAGHYGPPGLVIRTGDEEQNVSAEANAGQSFNALFEDSRGRMWIGGSESVAMHEGGTFQRIPAAPGRSGPVAKCFAENPVDGTIWAGGMDGLFKIAGGAFEEVPGPNGKSIRSVLCLRFQADGTLWVGTGNAGLHRQRGAAWAVLKTREGLPSNSVSSIVDDGLGNFWIGSNRGILRVPIAACDAVADGLRRELNGQPLAVADGMASIECTAGSQPNAIRDSQGRLWFATLKGVVATDPARFRPDTNPPPVRIESASYIDRDGVRRVMDIPGASPARVPAGSSQFEVRYSAPSFANPGKVRFRHRLMQGDRVLDQTDTSLRSTLWVLLSPGRYDFHVQAANHHGYWNTAGAGLKFTVLPFYWQTLWFRCLVAFAALAAVGGAVWNTQQARLRRQRDRLAHELDLSHERARLAVEVERSERTLRAFLDALPTPASLMDREGTFLGVNMPLARGMGRQPGELLGRSAYATLPENTMAARKAAMQEVVGTGRGTHFETTVGGRCYVNYLSPLTDPAGSVTGVAELALDVTEHRQLEERVRQAQKLEAIGQLAGGIAHDFNNILSAILLNAEMARDDVPEGHPAGENLDEITRAGKRARDLVQQILSFSRRQPEERRITAPGPVVEEAVRLLRATLPAGIRLTASIQPDVPLILANPTQLHQVLVNLGTNAWHAVETRGGQIEIRLDRVTFNSTEGTPAAGRRHGAFARITVQDSGVGMDAPTLERIFEPFFTTKPLGKGTGLGLSVVHGIVQSHEGTMTVSSRPDIGSTFEIYLPEAEGAASAPCDTPSAVPRGTGEHILYLDDDAAVLSVSRRFLERLGYRVSGFTSVRDALDAFRASPGQFSLVVTDLSMPEISGLEFAREILKVCPTMPVMLNSGHITEELMQEARDAGILEILQKPIALQDLEAGVHRLVSGRHQACQGSVAD